MNRLEDGELIIDTYQPHADVIRLDWRGRSAFRRPDEAIGPFLSDVLTKAKSSASGIEMHFETLEYFNSSTVAVLVQFLQRARVERVPLLFTYQQSVRWQRVSFEALRVFAQIDQLIKVAPAPG